jgi:predicted phage tail protein
MTRIKGAGGGGKGGGGGSARVPEEEKDSLKSRAYAKVLDLISEGPIVGLVSGLKSVFLDDTPIQNASGQNNFSGLKMDFRSGTQDQTYIPQFAETQNEIGVGIEIIEATPIIRSFTNPNLDAVRVRISVPQLTFQDGETGDLQGTRVTLRFHLQSNGGGYTTVFTDSIIGKSTSKYERQYEVRLVGDPPWDIKVERMTDDSDTVRLQNKTYFESYTEVVDSKLRYPNSALVGIQIDSTQFQSIPSRAYEIKGLEVQIPSNYNPVTRAYDGVWDGGFQIAWTNNPAWIFYDLLTNERYGLGRFITADHVDKWGLYTIAQYCDELVPDGFGSTEPRYTCNVYIQSRQEAISLLQSLASNFNAMIYWSGGVITLSQDAPRDAAYLFTPANVVDGLFTYSGASAKAKHSVALVTWNDPSDFYRQKVEYVEDQESIDQFGYVETQVVAYGCTSRGQANRYGRWLLYTERAQSEVVSFKTGLEASLCRPGQIIKIQDPSRAGSRLGGRIVAATLNTITIDQDVDFIVDQSTMSVMLSDGTVEDRLILFSVGRVVTLASNLSSVPQTNSVWLVQLANVEPQYFRVLTVAESNGAEYEVTAIAHNPDKFAAIEQGLVLVERPISTLSIEPAAPTGLQITETLYEVNGTVRVKVTISWNVVQYATSYLVQYKLDTGNLVVLPETGSNEVEIFDAEPGEYTANVTAISSIGIESLASTITKTVVGKALPPGTVQGFSMIPQANMAYLSWDKSTDLDVLIGGSVRIRYSSQINGIWKEAVDIAPGLSGSATRAQVPLLPGTYLAKFIDSSGNASMAAASISTTVPEYFNLNVVETLNESPSFPGVKTSMEYNADLLGLVISPDQLVDDIPDVDAVTSWDFAGGVAPTGEYEFQDVVDLGQVYTSRVTASIDVASVDVADTIDFRLALIDTWTDLDGDNIDDVNAELFLATTEDDPASMGAVWTEWKRFFVGDYSARGLKFKLVATAESDYHNIIIKTLAVTVDMPDRDEKFNNVASGTSTYTVTYAKPFKETPSVGITAYNMNSGDYWVISNNTVSGFDILFKNSGGSNVNRTFDVLARGYGRKLN